MKPHVVHVEDVGDVGTRTLPLAVLEEGQQHHGAQRRTPSDREGIVGPLRGPKFFLAFTPRRASLRPARRGASIVRPPSGVALVFDQPHWTHHRHTARVHPGHRRHRALGGRSKTRDAGHTPLTPSNLGGELVTNADVQPLTSPLPCQGRGKEVAHCDLAWRLSYHPHRFYLRGNCSPLTPHSSHLTTDPSPP